MEKLLEILQAIMSILVIIGLLIVLPVIYRILVI